jgi:hypothetical protein
VAFCRVSFLFTSNNGDHFRIIIAGAVGKHDPSSKLIPDLTDISPAPSNQEAVVLGFAANLDSVVLLSLRQGGREGGREGEGVREGKKNIFV